MRRLLLAAGLGLVALSGAGAVSVARAYEDFPVGANTENQPCRAQWRFEDAGAPHAVDLYCGKWDRPTGGLRRVAAAEAVQALAADCDGQPAVVADGEVRILQVACGPGQSGIRRYGLIAVRGDKAVVGAAYPSDWAPMSAAARVLLGLDKAGSVAADAPGARQLATVYPDGPPGQGAAFNYELLRRRAYEKNVAWSFGSSERDFAELLRAHARLAPDDQEGEAEILAEVGLNLSNARRFSEAGELFARAEAQARLAHADLLVTKIGNYRAIDQLNQGHPADALKLAQAANAERERLGLTSGARGGVALTAQDARIVASGQSRRGRGLVAVMEDVTPTERAEVLSAQGAYLAGSAARALHRPEAPALLDEALGHLSRSSVQPGWLAGMIYEERSAQRRASGDFAAAAAEARRGVRRIRELAPGTRAEARLLMAEAAALRDGGDAAGALAQGRAAIAILGRQTEAPGMPADLAAVHLETLYRLWDRSHDPAVADEYFQTLSLVWSGAASRAAAQMAARLGDHEGSDAVRAFQDAERGYRAALARRERLSVDPDAARDQIAEADRAVTGAGEVLTIAERRVRDQSPRYLELLNPEASPAQLRDSLNAGEGYIRIALAHDAGYGALVTREGVTPYRIGLGDAEAGRLSTRLRASATMNRRRLPDYDLKSAHALYQALFTPIEGAIGTLHTLHLDVGGALASAPLAALVVTTPTADQLSAVRRDQDYSDIDWLARRHAIDVALGPAAFIRTRAASAAAGAPTLAAYGDFQPNAGLASQRIAAAHGFTDRCRREIEAALGNLPALPDTAAEARGAAALFGGRGHALTGAGFTDTAFLSGDDAGKAGVLVLATHGVLGLSNCFPEPALLASVGPDGDGLIEASEILDRNLAARLVILSACDTAGGQAIDVGLTGLVDGGEALSGLARAFIYAGARSVLATNWKVDAASSSLQTQALLQSLSGGGVTVADALARSQRTLFTQAETAHPFYWAGFSLIGDGGAKL